jgi:hypothetical protein
MNTNKPIVVCIIGSSKFKDRILGLTQRETLNGKIAINHGFFHHVDMVPISDEKKDELDRLMLRKIDLADEVLVADFNSYVGRSTQIAIEYAEKSRKPVRCFTDEEVARRERTNLIKELRHKYGTSSGDT